MEKSNLISLSPDSIKSILTLRYNSEINPILPRLTSIDFIPTFKKYSTEFIKKSIKNTLKSSIPKDCKKISIALSGGIDSTLSLALLRETFPDLEIFAISMKFADSFDETSIALKIAKHFNVQHQIINLENFLIELPKAISIVKQPFWDLHWYHVVKQAKANGSYLVSGDGGDELFGGYTFRYKKFLSKINFNSSPNDRINAYLQCHNRDWVEDQIDLFDHKAIFEWSQIHKKLIQYFENSLLPIQQIFLADYNGKLLYNFSPVNSALHEGFNLNSITPLLSKELIFYASHLSPELKYDEKNNFGKLPLRKLLEGYIDSDKLTKTKQGFSVNTLNLWKRVGYKLCSKYLTNARIVKDNWINSSWIDKNLKKELDVQYVNKFLGLLAFEIWYRIFITKEFEPESELCI